MRGQGYDNDSNMNGQIIEVQKRNLDMNPTTVVLVVVV